MIVRAYFLLDDPFSGGEVVNEPALVPVLRTVRKSTATAAARRHEAPRHRDLERPGDGRSVRRLRLGRS
jgi:ABC-type uncharacterized transport system ATPase subunit